MTEAFLHYLWKFKLFNQLDLKTTEGESLKVVHPGQHNSDSGPDFFNARLKIGTTSWAGNVEIHGKSSDWYKHNHQQDKAYDNIILHVVYEDDQQVLRNNSTPVPTLELRNKFNKKLWKNYEALIESDQWIPCEKKIAAVDSFTVDNWLDRLLAERLQEKTQVIIDSLRFASNSWEECFYHLLAKNFGFKLNALSFELLAKSLPVAYLGKHKNNLMQVEALLFGVAGMLEKDFKDEYPQQLQKEFNFLQKKFQLKPLLLHQWKFLRLRPANFPTLRLSQFAQLIHRSSGLFSSCIEEDSLKKVKAMFEVSSSSYWNTHYNFDKASKSTNAKDLGEVAIDNILINTIIPFLFAYGVQRGSENHRERALKWLEGLKPESNGILKKWAGLGVIPAHAGHGQALLQLKNGYCDGKKCLLCSIGNKLIQQVR